MKHHQVNFEPDKIKVSLHAGSTILEAAESVGIILNTICGGKGSCEKCLVIIEPDNKKVLACQYKIEKDLTVRIPVSSRFFEQKILTKGVPTGTQIPPTIYKKYLQLAGEGQLFGVAVDIGTTTVVAKLIDMKTAGIIATQADSNPQSRYGDDVISRISYAEHPENLKKLNKLIIDCINELIKKLCDYASIGADQIYEVCVVANTTMGHIFLKYPVTQLGLAPYEAFSTESKDSPPQALGINFNTIGNVHTVENIASFVGSDTLAAALAAGIDQAQESALLVDIGTNGEVVLFTKDKLLAASCAAGPAFEGARITCGSRAVEGAIETVFIDNGDIDVDIIGQLPACSICGSGLIDAIALLLHLGIIDNTGRFVKRCDLEKSLSPGLLSRITEQHNQTSFCLSDTGDTKVILTQHDVRQVQLAKAAIRAGIKLLQKKLGLQDNDIKRIFLAGAFGNYIHRESALRIGLLPNVEPETIHFVGNAAVSGAEMILLSDKSREAAGRLAQKIEYIETATEQDFANLFAESITF